MKIKVLFTVLLVFLTQNLFPEGLHDVYSQYGNLVIAVGTNGVVLRSKNGGAAYSRFYAGSNNLNGIYSIINLVWAAGDNGSCYKSLDTGTTWFSQNTGVAANLNSVYFIDSLTGFIAGTGGALIKTTNGGTGWSIISIPSSNTLNRIRFIDQNTGFICGNNGTFLKTTNGGNLWNLIPLPVSKNITSFDVKGNLIVAGTPDPVIIRSTDLGASWMTNNFKIYCNPGITSVSLQDSLIVFISFESGAIWYSVNGGETFGYSYSPMQDEIHSICTIGPRSYAVSKNQEVVIRRPSLLYEWNLPNNVSYNIHFETVLEPMGGSYNRILELNYQKRGTLYALQGNVLKRSMDFGESWSQISVIPNGIEAQQLLVSMNDSSKMIAVSNDIGGNNAKIFRTINYGINWNLVYSGNWDIIGNLITQDALHPDTLFLGIRDSVIRSSDFGASWTKIYSAPLADWCDIAVNPLNDKILYGSVSHFPARLIKSTDGGFTWSNIDVVFDTNYSEMPAISLSNLNGNIVYHAQNSSRLSQNGLKRSYSQGNTWLYDQFAGVSWAVDISRDNPFLYAYGSVGTGQPVYLSTNGGINYINAPNTWAEQLLFYDNSNLFSTDGSEIYKMRVTYNLPIGIEQISAAVPDEFSLGQNFPNPFNPTTKIRFAVANVRGADQPIVKLTVFDILGREIEILADGRYSPGTYEVEWNAIKFGSGIYFYKITAGDYSATRKMVLVK